VMTTFSVPKLFSTGLWTRVLACHRNGDSTLASEVRPTE